MIRRGRWRVAGTVAFLKAILITILAGFGVMLVHYRGVETGNSFGLGMGAFAIVGALMLYRIWFGVGESVHLLFPLSVPF
jgi:hypothetical protein